MTDHDIIDLPKWVPDATPLPPNVVDQIFAYRNEGRHIQALPLVTEAIKEGSPNRKDPNFTGTEVQYGETQPFSLPKKIAQYTAERATRADQINVQDAQINAIAG